MATQVHSCHGNVDTYIRLVAYSFFVPSLPCPSPCPAQLAEVEEAARCAFSHAFLDPEDPTTKRNLPLYRDELGMRRDQFVWRPEVPGVKESTRLYLEGEAAYNSDQWEKCAVAFEQSFNLQMEVCVCVCVQ